VPSFRAAPGVEKRTECTSIRDFVDRLMPAIDPFETSTIQRSRRDELSQSCCLRCDPLPGRGIFGFAPKSAPHAAGRVLASPGGRVHRIPRRLQACSAVVCLFLPSAMAHFWDTSSVMTLNRASIAGPNAVEMATSAASLPRAMRIRPIRGRLCRASSTHQRPPQEDLEPRGKVHWGRVRGHANIPEVAGAIAGRDVHAPA
jgi:hypothetical protein